LRPGSFCREAPEVSGFLTGPIDEMKSNSYKAFDLTPIKHWMRYTVILLISHHEHP